jgi:hypothetical protein
VSAVKWASRFVASAFVVTVGCADRLPDDGAVLAAAVPTYASYADAGVDDFLGRRCASLDCHGQDGRPLRIYSASALRMHDGGPDLFPGGAPLAEPEREANYQAVIGLEPDLLARVAAKQASPYDLLLVRKPRDLRHKGGTVIAPGGLDDGERCLTRWAAGSPPQGACARAANAP